jgi:haloalkane dehalogenase
VRTPDLAFANLPGYPFAPQYLELDGLRMHYVDEGPRESTEIFLCLHGNPSWSFLYRKMIPVFTAAGKRVIAPDLLGFGRSDKPALESDHTWALHLNSLKHLITQLNLQNITLVVQDWGGLFGLTLPMTMPERFTRLLVMNTALAIGKLPTEGFIQWRHFSNSQNDLDIGKMLKRGAPMMSAEEAAAYNAPFPDAHYKAAIRAFPNLVPETPEQDGAALSREAMQWWQTQWRGQSFMAVGVKDPVLGLDVMTGLQGIIRNCPAPYLVPEGGHFVQEWGEEIARAALDYFDQH